MKNRKLFQNMRLKLKSYKIDQQKKLEKWKTQMGILKRCMNRKSTIMKSR